jgi:eukaryotic-like serine/threonine-protein kinase
MCEEDPSQETERGCPVCGVELPGDAPRGLCPRCLATAAGGPGSPRAEPLPGHTPKLRVPTVRYFGDYELLGELAHGGMGIVYYARQVSLNRAVALKIIRSGHFAADAEVERFHTEAQAAASLDHPNIVPLHEIGQHEGHHFFSMKLIEGGNLAEWTTTRNAPPDATPSARSESRNQKSEIQTAVRLLATVADAVHHAHQRGILHRDLKPTNILLDSEGRPHLTDFGLAKLLWRERSTTVTDAILGTPTYMAPEQAGGDAKHITTAADIYSLGAILYELLTGQPPFTGAEPLEILDKVRTQEPPRPRALNPRVDHDLETICLKCLDKEPTRRYATAKALDEDLKRWLTGEPILARPTTTVERARKWAKRNPAVASLVVLAHILFIAGIVGVLWQWRRAEINAEQAAEQARRAEAGARSARENAARSAQFAQFLQEMLEGVGPSAALGRDTTMLREVLDRTAEQIGTAGPEVELEMRRTLGGVYHDLGEFEAAEAMFRRAKMLHQNLYPGLPAFADSLDNLADSLRSQAQLVASETLHYRPGTARTPSAQKIQEKLAEAEDLYQQALAVRLKLWGGEHPDVADSLKNLAAIAYYQRRLPEAEALGHQALAMARRFLPETHPSVLTKLTNLAMILGDAGKLEEAEALYLQALAVDRQRLREPHPTLVTVLANLGLVVKRQGRFAGAESFYTEALDMERQLARSDHPSLAQLLNELADVLQKQGRFAEAEPLARESLEVRLRLFGDEHVEVAAALDNLGLVLSAQGNFDDAEPLHQQALAMRQELLGSEHPHVVRSLNSLSILRERQGRLTDSEALLQEAIALEGRISDDSRPYAPERAGSSLLVELLIDLAHTQQRQRRLDDAEAALLEALDYLRKPSAAVTTVNTPALRKVLRRLAALCMETNRPEQAAEWERELAKIEE